MLDAEEKQKAHRNNAVKWVVAGAAGLFSGVAALTATVRKSFYRELRTWPGFEDDYKKYGEALDQKTIELKGKPFNLLEHEISAIKENYSMARDAKLLEEYGIHSRGWKGFTEGTLQRLKLSGSGTKSTVVFNSAISTVVGIAGTAMFFNSLATGHKLRHLDQALKDKEAAEQQR